MVDLEAYFKVMFADENLITHYFKQCDNNLAKVFDRNFENEPSYAKVHLLLTTICLELKN